MIKLPVLPIAGATAVRASFGALALVTYWLKELARARRHRREACALAGLDRRMLADIGITRSDVQDAFSEPFWQDPTALLSKRVDERRRNRGRGALRLQVMAHTRNGFRQAPIDRAARHTA